MAYCKECGAYVADGFEKCPACGAAAKTIWRKKEKDDSWDIYKDNGYKGGADYRQALEEELHQEEPNAGEWSYSEPVHEGRVLESEPDAGGWNYSEPVYEGRVIESEPDGAARLLAAASYWSWLFILPLLLRKDDDFVKPHLNQGIALFIISTVCSWMGFLGGIVNIGVFVLRIMGFVNALRGKDYRLPLVSEIVIIK